MDIRNLPKVVMSNDDFRIIALERTDQSQGFHATHFVMNVQDSDGNYSYGVRLVAEEHRKNALGEVSWNDIGMQRAVNFIFLSNVMNSLSNAVTSDNATTKKQQTNKQPSLSKSK